MSDHDGSAVAGAPATGAGKCALRLFLPTVDARLIALSAKTGAVCPDFGGDGTVDLWQNTPNVTPGSNSTADVN